MIYESVTPVAYLIITIFFSLGVFLMISGADRLVNSGSALAKHFRISPLIIGLTIVSFGTSFPEFAASLVGALRGKTDIAMGNVVGSNICNLGLVLGAAAVTRPISVRAGILRKEIPFVLLISGLSWWMARDNRISRGEGGFLFGLFLLFLWYCIRAARQKHSDIAVEIPVVVDRGPTRETFRLVFGLILLFVGADFTIRSAVKLAERLEISQAVIGLTIVALGTSLPELVTSVVALKKNQGDIGLGNVLGSNVFNLLFILGVTALVRPIPSSAGFFRFDIPVMILFTLILIPIAKNQMRISRFEGGALLFAYGAYLFFLVFSDRILV